VPGPDVGHRRDVPGKFFLLIRRITMRSARTWLGQRCAPGPGSSTVRRHCRRPDPVRAPITSGYNFWKVTGTERVLLQ
jgi:hypothetical protein